MGSFFIALLQLGDTSHLEATPTSVVDKTISETEEAPRVQAVLLLG
jgi:hypothetical protein